MKTLAVVVSALLSVASANVHAQRAPGSPSTQGQAGAASTISDAELDTFVTIYVDLLKTVAKYEPQMQSAQSEQQAQDIRVKMQQESIEKVASRGWTPEKFNSVAQAINGDQQLSDRAAKLIEEKG
jgi:hypothetical protein